MHRTSQAHREPDLSAIRWSRLSTTAANASVMISDEFRIQVMIVQPQGTDADLQCSVIKQHMMIGTDNQDVSLGIWSMVGCAKGFEMVRFAIES